MAKSAANSRLQACLDHSITAQGDRWESPIAAMSAHQRFQLWGMIPEYSTQPIKRTKILPLNRSSQCSKYADQPGHSTNHGLYFKCCNPVAYSQNTFQEAWLAFNWTKLLNVSNATQNRPQCWLIHIWSLSSEEQDKSILLREINLFWSCRQQT